MLGRVRRSIVLPGIVLLVAAGCQQVAPDVAVANKDVVRQFYAAVDKNDFTKLDTLLADDFVLDLVGVPEPLDRKGFLGLIPSFLKSFPDCTHQVDELVVEGDRVAAMVTLHATHKGEFEGIPATGKAVTQNQHAIFTVVNGKIRHAWALDDNLGLMTQLGMTLAPASAKQ